MPRKCFQEWNITLGLGWVVWTKQGKSQRQRVLDEKGSYIPLILSAGVSSFPESMKVWLTVFIEDSSHTHTAETHSQMRPPLFISLYKGYQIPVWRCVWVCVWVLYPFLSHFRFFGMGFTVQSKGLKMKGVVGCDKWLSNYQISANSFVV